MESQRRNGDIGVNAGREREGGAQEGGVRCSNRYAWRASIGPSAAQRRTVRVADKHRSSQWTRSEIPSARGPVEPNRCRHFAADKRTGRWSTPHSIQHKQAH